ncbi:hypothetical protein COO60DRAFT_282614 [Scenedesmus sp. NREL 46B-D3]|nr:hypothetical protein COO60DRAFT_282614 [Scenedesmus sp. NREL 46B-D3]
MAAMCWLLLVNMHSTVDGSLYSACSANIFQSTSEDKSCVLPAAVGCLTFWHCGLFDILACSILMVEGCVEFSTCERTRH